jgi:signal transduction histidine kinase
MTRDKAPVPLLLVDDLEENLLSLEALLKRDDLTLLKARSGDEALELLLRQDVALALLDVQMPGMNGFELAEFMRGIERTRHVPIIFLTAGTADAQRRFQGYEAGAVDFIQKPIEADILRSKVGVFVELYRQRNQIAAQRDELAAATEALRQADRRKDEFLAVLAHELRNPLASLHAGVNLLQRKAGTPQATMIQESMDRQIFHLARLVDDLLDISRISEGKIALRKEKLDLADILNLAIEGSQAHIDAGGHKFTVEQPDRPTPVHADLTRMAQIVSNLLNNAAKYTPASGEIALCARSTGREIEIIVRDNGLGIPPDMQERIFDIFAQVDEHREQAGNGLGIGLALVRQLVRLHNGTIRVESAGHGQGSAFIVRFPAGEENSGRIP